MASSKEPKTKWFHYADYRLSEAASIILSVITEMEEHECIDEMRSLVLQEDLRAARDYIMVVAMESAEKNSRASLDKAVETTGVVVFAAPDKGTYDAKHSIPRLNRP